MLGQDGWILTKFFFAFLLAKTRPISSHHDRTSLVNKRFVIWPKTDLFLAGKSRTGKKGSSCPLSSQSQRTIRVILPARRFSHTIRLNNIDIIMTDSADKAIPLDCFKGTLEGLLWYLAPHSMHTA